MKKKIFKFVIELFVFILLFPSIVKAQCYTVPATKVDVSIVNINESIKNIWLVIYDNNCNIEDAYKNSNLNLSNAKFESSSNKKYKNVARITKEVAPFGDNEDNESYLNYDQKNYIIELSDSYTYKYGKNREKTFEWDHLNSKLKTVEDLTESMSANDKEIIRQGEFSCEQDIYLLAKRIIEVEEIPVEKIAEGKLDFSITNFSEFNKYRKKDKEAGFALRFEKENGEYKIIHLGNNDTEQNRCKKNEIDEKNIELGIAADYSSNEKAYPYNNLLNCDRGNIDPCEGVETVISYIIPIILITILLLISSFIPSKLLKIKVRAIMIIMNILFRILIYLLANMISPGIILEELFGISFSTFALEAIIILAAFGVYKILIKHYSTKELLLYSLLSNVTFCIITHLCYYAMFLINMLFG